MKTKLKRRLYSGRDNQWIGLVFAIPFVAGYLLLFLPMILNSLSFSFNEIHITQTGYDKEFVAWDNYYFALRIDSGFSRSLIAALSSMLTSIPVITIFSLFIAVILNRNLPGRNVFRAIFFVPVILTVGVLSRLDTDNALMATMASAAVDTGLHSEGGNSADIMNNITVFLQSMNFNRQIVGFVSGAANGITTIIKQSGVQILISLAALQSIKPSIYEAANVEGATAWEVFWKITFPLAIPVLAVNVFYTVISQLSDSVSWLPTYIQRMTDARGFGVGAAMSWLYILSAALMIGGIALAVFLVVRVRSRT